MLNIRRIANNRLNECIGEFVHAYSKMINMIMKSHLFACKKLEVTFPRLYKNII